MKPYFLYSNYIEDAVETYKDIVIISDTQHRKGFPAPRKVKAYSKKKMKYTAGRNETCPCGSGNKFKRCCVNIEA